MNIKNFIHNIFHKEKKISDIDRMITTLEKKNAAIVSIQDEMIKKDPSLKKFRF